MKSPVITKTLVVSEKTKELMLENSLSIDSDTLREYYQRRVIPGVTEAGIPFLILAPSLKRGGSALADHIHPSVVVCRKLKARSLIVSG